jgi:hypothetical protein
MTRANGGRWIVRLSHSRRVTIQPLNEPSLKIMNTTNATPFLVTLAIGMLAAGLVSAQDTKRAVPKRREIAAPAPMPSPAEAEARFKRLFTNATLAGRWAPLKDGALGEERSGDRYRIVSVARGEGDNWTINARMKYRDQEIIMPIPARVTFSGDHAVLVVNDLTIPGGNTYSARLLIHGRTYSGSWEGGRGGGMLYGVIANDPE